MNTTVELVRKSEAVSRLAEVLESEAQLADELATERKRSGILLVACTLLFLLSLVLMAVVFA